MNCFCNVSSIFTFITRLNLWISYFQLKIIDNLDCVGSNTEFNLQERILDQTKVYETNSNCKKTSHSDPYLELSNEPKPSKKLTLWIQLTLSKLCFVILGKLTANAELEGKLISCIV